MREQTKFKHWTGAARLTAIGALISTAVGILAACVPIPRATETPIPTRIHGNLDTARRVYILLPGVHDDLDSFQRKGFIDIARKELRDRERAAFVAVDAHLGYYRDQSFDRRIEDDIISRFPGKRLTLVGVSLGGLGALATARRFPELFDEVVVLAPFLGRRELIERIRNGNDDPEADVFDREITAIWRWLSNGAARPRVSVHYGRNDRFRAAYKALGEHAPAVSFHSVKGGHDWATWNELWRRWLKRPESERSPATP